MNHIAFSLSANISLFGILLIPVLGHASVTFVMGSN